jgi:virulence-associated protein VagC
MIAPAGVFPEVREESVRLPMAARLREVVHEVMTQTEDEARLPSRIGKDLKDWKDATTSP